MLSYAAPTVQQFRSSLSSPFPTDPPSRPQSTAPPTFGTAGYSYNPSRTSSVVSGRQSAAQVQVQAQAQHPPSLQRSFSGDSEYGQIPALSALASLAANAPAAVDTRSIGSTRSSTPNSTNMSQPQYAPAATAGGTQQGGPPVCQNCSTSTTPLWRRDESGSVLCNACGLFLKLHGRPRPISLKTDVIKSRNRVKTSQIKKRDSTDGQPIQPQSGLAAAHPDVAHAGLHPHAHLNTYPTPDAPQRVPSPGSISRSNTPTGLSHNPNIAPQHIFDTVTLPADSFASPNLPAFNFRQPSPSASSLNGASHLEAPQTYDALSAQNSHLRTRVSELEVINDLFRSRVGELENIEQEARRAANAKEEENRRLGSDLETANRQLAEMQKRVAELEAQESPARKRARRSCEDEKGEIDPAIGSSSFMIP